jgi:protein-S-isoprenylcysteine O-methyltransferase Ste14
MAKSHSSIIGKVSYGVLFTVALPLLLAVWAKTTKPRVPLDMVGTRATGVAIISFGATVLIAGMAALIVYGKGLPMNAYPPMRFVARGIYRFIAHPIYVGFCLICVGAAVVANSPSGLWLVSPIVVLACVALVQGFERDDLRKRFGKELRPWLSLPRDENSSPSFADRVSVYVLVIIPWFVLYEAVRIIGVPGDAVSAYLPFENHLPVYQWTELIYMSTYFFALLAPLVAKTRHDLREASIAGLIGTGIIVLLFLTIPVIAPPRAFISHGLPGDLLNWERSIDTPAAAFPSFHVFWAFMAATVYTGRMHSLKIIWWTWAILISISCVTTSMHAIVDVLAGFLVFLIVMNRAVVWEWMRKITERVANSWQEWRAGPIRIINHGLYAGVSAFVGISLIAAFAGPKYLLSAIVIGLSSLVGAAVWGQAVEGSPSLLRPYGWYGGILAAALAIAVLSFFNLNLWLMLGAGSVAAPWLQSLGRLRCLVQGCCHGREAPTGAGICYTHPMSRVSRLTSLRGKSIHPTPLYSILANVVIGLLLARLWLLGCVISMIVGLYLILAGLARFVEESYRGEPQTPIRAGLSIYQWLAIAGVLIGILVTMIDNAPSAPAPQLTWPSILLAFAFGWLALFALGVDFPNSNRRFARLA